jgi:hypothetical protein
MVILLYWIPEMRAIINNRNQIGNWTDMMQGVTENAYFWHNEVLIEA